MARPRSIDREALLVAFEAYIDATPLPIISEFCAQNRVHKQRLYEFAKDNEALDDALKFAITKKEGALERGCLNGTLTPSMAIFSLKQLGWRDVIEQNGNQAVTLTIGAADKKL